MGLSFLLIFTAFQTMNGIFQSVIDSYNYFHPHLNVRFHKKNERNKPKFQTANGLVAMGIMITVQARDRSRMHENRSHRTGATSTLDTGGC